jgi:hypothetical protein
LRPWLQRGETWVSLGATLVVVLVITNMVLFEMNHGLQTEVNSRQQFIQQSLQLEALNREIVSAIANLSIRNRDEALRTVLTQHGITFSANPPSTPPAVSLPASSPPLAPGSTATKKTSP